MNDATKRSLQGVKIGISIGRGEDLATLGFSFDELNRIHLRLCETLLGDGAHLVLGHRWTKGGVIDVIHNAAIYQYTGEPQITNLLAWPNQPGLSEDERSRYADVLTIREVGQPESEKDRVLSSDAPNYRQLKDEAMTKMRVEMANIVDVLICLGGKTVAQKGKISGVLEEFLAVTKAKKPVFVSKLIGGASKLIAEVIEGGVFKEWAIRQLLDWARVTADEREELRKTLDNLTLNTMSERNRMSQIECSEFMNANTHYEYTVLLMRALRNLFTK